MLGRLLSGVVVVIALSGIVVAGPWEDEHHGGAGSPQTLIEQLVPVVAPRTIDGRGSQYDVVL
jgi:hypothetical protein